jgi:hypothetical protein
MSDRNRLTLRCFPALARLFASAMIVLAFASGALANEADKKPAPSETEALFLDRLMQAESGGRLNAKNPRSSALGPFQFIESTFYEVVTQHLPDVAVDKSYTEIQQLRTDLAVSRSAALAYTRQNAVFLNKRGIKPEAGYLRLAFLLGASGAADVIAAKPDTLLSELLSGSALAANPFMKSMSAKQLIERAKREAAGLKPLPIVAQNLAASAHPKIRVRCNLKRASCRKWLALAKKRLARKERAD